MPLILVPTPLGNLRDITLRALDTLRDCELIVAEDTRVTHRLLSALGIASKPIWSYREQNAQSVTAGILERATSAVVAVVSDAGMPAISDPGSELVAAARVAGIAVEVLPGPCAFVCAAVLSGYDLRRLTFEGFVPRRRNERERALRTAYESGSTSVWYESPRRIAETLATLAGIDADMEVFIARELSKLHEQQVAGTPSAVAGALPEPPLGEFALVLRGRMRDTSPSADAPMDDALAVAEIDRALDRGEAAPAIARDLAKRGFGTRADLYARVSQRRGERKP